MTTHEESARKPLKPAPEYENSSASKFAFEPSLAANNARQGVTGHGVRFVLALSIMGALAVFIALIFWVY